MCFFYVDTEDELLDTIDEIVARLESVELFAAAHKCTFFPREIVWCGKVYSQGVCRMMAYACKVCLI